ncbi:aminoglycoside phosphotransferase family protein [Oscillospiraceae bacterium OttesenSCG-928-F05]|nr:aminoglycoside phosphotransferase family protein [Oscillospiraceae bacterium OttesenSCG-928-F05]
MTLDVIIAERKTKTIYRDGDLAIKLFVEGYSAADVLNEAHNHAIVEETGFSVPHLEEVTKIDGRWAIVTRFIEGKTLAQMMAEAPGQAESYLQRFVDIQLDMHSYKATKLRHHTDKMQAKISQSGLEATNRYELHVRLDSMPKHYKLCHGDFNPSNVIITPDDRVCVIDWAHATQGNASAGAARTYMLFMLEGEEAAAEKYLTLFCRKSDTARQYVERWLPIVAASQLVKKIPEQREFLTRWANIVEYE